MLENWPKGEGMSGDIYLRVTFFQSLILAKAVFVGLLFYYHGSIWIIAVPVLSTAAFAEFCAPADSPSNVRWPFRAHWAIPIVVTLVVALECVVPAAFAFVLAWLIGPACQRTCLKTMGVFGDPGKSATMELVEFAALGLGAVYFVSASPL